MQAVHFCFTLGGMLSPLVAQPFLAADNCLAEEGNNGSLTPRNISESLKNFSASEKHFFEISEVDQMRSELRNISSNHHEVNYSFIWDLTSCANEKTRVHYAYLISGMMIAITALPFFASMCSPKITKSSGHKTEVDENGTKPVSASYPCI